MSAEIATPPSLEAMFGLKGRVALVTGSSRGIGWAIAKALAGAGAHVVLNGRDGATLAPRLAELERWGFPGEALPFDVTDARATNEAVAALGRKHGRLDILISNAGGIVRKPLLEQTEADWQGVIDADLTASWRLAREAARLMVPARSGRIVVTSSIMGHVARPGITGYVAAKAGLHGLVRGLAVELAPDGVSVNALAPGYFPTEGNRAMRETNPEFARWITGRTPMARWGDLAEIGAAALYLASPAAGFTTGSILTVDGGLTAAI